MIKNGMRPIHPGEILREEYLRPLGLSANKLSKLIRVPANRVTSIVNGSRNITADTALRLGLVLGTTPQFWLNLQQTYELRVEETNPTRTAAAPTRPAAQAQDHARRAREDGRRARECGEEAGGEEGGARTAGYWRAEVRGSRRGATWRKG